LRSSRFFTLVSGAVLCVVEGHPEDHHLLICENCSSMEADILSGKDILVERVEAEKKG
jgi:Zn finger protein HypA/HybF involved in hydrogenase expression